MNEPLQDRRDASRPLVVPGPHVVASGRPAHVRIPAASSLKQPQLELIREGDWIRAIDVTCACGEKVRIVCEYETS